MVEIALKLGLAGPPHTLRGLTVSDEVQAEKLGSATREWFPLALRICQPPHLPHQGHSEHLDRAHKPTTPAQPWAETAAVDGYLAWWQT